MKSGQFVYLHLDDDSRIDSSFISIPTYSVIGNTGFFLEKKLNTGSKEDQSISVVSTLGIDSMTQTENALIFANDSAIEVVKIDSHSGKLV